jgi:hypothetical protein
MAAEGRTRGFKPLKLSFLFDCAGLERNHMLLVTGKLRNLTRGNWKKPVRLPQDNKAALTMTTPMA